MLLNMGFQGLDLLIEIIGGVSLQRDLQPVESRLCVLRYRIEPGGLPVQQVGYDKYRLRVLEETIGHLLQADAHVLLADLFTHDQERDCGELAVQAPHHPVEDRSVAHSGIEDLERRRERDGCDETPWRPALQSLASRCRW